MLLGFLHPASSRRGELPALARSGFRRGGDLAGATGQHGSDFSNLSLDAPFLGFETNKGGLKDGVVECAHVAKQRVYTGFGRSA